MQQNSFSYICKPLILPRLSSRAAIIIPSIYTAPILYQKRLQGLQSFTTLFPCHRRWLNTSPPDYGVVNFKLADIGEGIAEVELLQWHKNVGDQMEEMEPVCVVQSDKAAVEITSRFTGTVVDLKYKVGDMIKIGDVLMRIDCEGEEDEPAPPSAPQKEVPVEKSVEAQQAVKADNIGGVSVAVPAARRLAKELGIDISQVKGSGKGGRITKEDVEAHAKDGGGTSTSSTAASAHPSAGPSEIPMTPSPPIAVPSRPPRENRTIQLRGFARAMFKSMTETANVPHLNIGDELDVTDLLRMRARMKGTVEKEYGLKLTMTSLFVKAVSLALNKHPILNSKLASDTEVTIFGSHNISMAIDTPHGLVVPNIKNVQDLSVIEIQSELVRLQQLAQSNKLSNDDLSGGTVCISNVGVIAGTYVKALLFDKQAMIIGIGKTQQLPRFNERKEVVARDILNVGISADHRHCDGATVARYIADLKQYLEGPETMLLHMQ